MTSLLVSILIYWWEVYCHWTPYLLSEHLRIYLVVLEAFVCKDYLISFPVRPLSSRLMTHIQGRTTATVVLPLEKYLFSTRFIKFRYHSRNYFILPLSILTVVWSNPKLRKAAISRLQMHTAMFLVFLNEESALNRVWWIIVRFTTNFPPMRRPKRFVILMLFLWSGDRFSLLPPVHTVAKYYPLYRVN